jgi:hypothetical protein
MPVPEHLKNHPVFSGKGSFGIMSAEDPYFPAETASTSENLGAHLKALGLHHEPVVGQYENARENSSLIHNPTREQMMDLGRRFGQESVVFSQNGNHEILYTNGPHKGKSRVQHPELPTSEFLTEPPQHGGYTQLPGGEMFRLNFDWGRQPAVVRDTQSHPHDYSWHDTNTYHSRFDKGYSGNSLKKSEQPLDMKLLTPFGTVGGPQSPTDFSHLLGHKLADTEELAAKYGYKTFLHSGRYGAPDFEAHNYSTGFLPISDPGATDHATESGVRAYRTLHELAHALTYPEINKLYGESRRSGAMGERTPHETMRSVHWEDLASKRQRALASEIGVAVSDPDFNKDRNSVMADAVHRAVTGRESTPLSQLGFVPHSHEVPLSTALDSVRAAAEERGIPGLHDHAAPKVSVAKSLAKSDTVKAAFRHKKTGAVVTAEHFHDPSVLPEGHSKTDYDEGFVERGAFHTRDEYKKKYPRKMKIKKAELPAPVIHTSVEGFLKGLQAIPKGTPERGKFITRHMGHAGFIGALRAHAQGPQIFKMLTAHLNSPANAGPGRAVVTAKSEDGVILLDGSKHVATDPIAALERIQVLSAKLYELHKKELEKQLIPPHDHNVGVTVGAGMEDVAPGRLDHRGQIGGTATRNLPRKPQGVVKAAPTETSAEASAEASAEESTKGREESTVAALCKLCKKGPCACAAKGEMSATGVLPGDKPVKESSVDGTGGKIKSVSAIRKSAMESMQKAEIAPGVHSDAVAKPTPTVFPAAPANAPHSTRLTEALKLGQPVHAMAHPNGMLEFVPPGMVRNISVTQKRPVFMVHPAPVAKAEPPMAKPPGGKNMATHTPTSKPAAVAPPKTKIPKPKAKIAVATMTSGNVGNAGAAMGTAAGGGLGKGVMSDIAQRESQSMGGPTAVAPAPKAALPSPSQQEDRAAMFAGAMAGDYTPPAAAPKPRVVAVNPVGAIPATKLTKRPGIFGRLPLNNPK